MRERARASINNLFVEGFHADAAAVSGLLDELKAARTALAEIAVTLKSIKTLLVGDPSALAVAIRTTIDGLLTTHAAAIKGAR